MRLRAQRGVALVLVLWVSVLLTVPRLPGGKLDEPEEPARDLLDYLGESLTLGTESRRSARGGTW